MMEQISDDIEAEPVVSRELAAVTRVDQNVTVKTGGLHDIYSNLQMQFMKFLDYILQIKLQFACRRIYKSSAAILQEAQRQQQMNRYIIHQYSLFRWYWDVVMVITLIITLFVMPVEVAFYSETFDNLEEMELHNERRQRWIVINILVDLLFLIDIVLNFRTAYVDHATERVIMDNKKIAIHYLKGWFAIDFLSSFPFDIIYESSFGSAAESDETVYLTLRIMKLAKVMSLLRILRIARLLRYINDMEEVLNIEGALISIFHLTLVTMIFCHWTACVHYLIAFLEGFPQYSWVNKCQLMEANVTVWQKYSFSVFRSIAHMLALGLGDGVFTSKITMVELWCGITNYLIGGTFYALFIAHISNLVLNLNLARRHYEQKISEVKEYMRFRKIPPGLQTRVLNFYAHKYQQKYFDEQGILFDPDMSPVLRHELLMFNCRGLILKVPFLRNASPEFHYDIICQLRFQIYFPGDVIVQEGRKGSAMFFIEHGSVEVILPNGIVHKNLTDGDIFGEIALLMDERRTASVVACEVTDVYMLSKDDFNRVLNEHPEMRELLRMKARERLESLAVAEKRKTQKRSSSKTADAIKNKVVDADFEDMKKKFEEKIESPEKENSIIEEEEVEDELSTQSGFYQDQSKTSLSEKVSSTASVKKRKSQETIEMGELIGDELTPIENVLPSHHSDINRVADEAIELGMVDDVLDSSRPSVHSNQIGDSDERIELGSVEESEMNAKGEESLIDNVENQTDEGHDPGQSSSWKGEEEEDEINV